MKVAIIGKGTSSIITALKCVSHNIDVEIYYDPNIPYVNVGETTTPVVSELLRNVTGVSISELYQKGIAAIKTGIKFIDWGKNDVFYHNFENAMSMQFETNKFNPFVHQILEEKGFVTYIAENVKEYKIIDNQVIINNRIYDFVIFCTGFSDHDEYYPAYIKSVNSGILYVQNHVETDETYSIHKATEDGWQFGLPFPKFKITKCGYLYDSTISDPKEMEEKVNKFENCNVVNHIHWKQKYAKNLLQNKYCAYNGNRLFFFEPLQALSLHYYEIFAEIICAYLKFKDISYFYAANNQYHFGIWQQQLTLAHHYRYGSKYKTDFWNQISKESELFIDKTPIRSTDILLDNMIGDYLIRTSSYSTIGPMQKNDCKQLYCGFSGEQYEDIYKKYTKKLEDFNNTVWSNDPYENFYE